jgi:hypothetical protein
VRDKAVAAAPGKGKDDVPEEEDDVVEISGASYSAGAQITIVDGEGNPLAHGNVTDDDPAVQDIFVDQVGWCYIYPIQRY